ncbi:hypothetical protein ACK3TF_005189 [Chlorella vulgaris]
MSSPAIALRRSKRAASPEREACKEDHQPCVASPTATAAAPRCSSASPSVMHQEWAGAATSPGDKDRPITPDPTPAQAGATPDAHSRQQVRAAAKSVCAALSACHVSAAAAQPAAAVAAAAAPAGADLATWRRVHSFVACVVRSELIQSALCSLLLGAGSDNPEVAPGTDGAALPPTANLQLTLAQMLALFLRAGYEKAGEDTLLAVLWVLESTGSAWRSPASICLPAYLKHLALFSPEIVAHLTADWPASFVRLRSAVVAAQKDLLAQVSWRVRLDMHAAVRPCHHWLFHAPASWGLLCTQLSVESDTAADASQPLAEPPASAWGPWATHMHELCAFVQAQAQAMPPRPPATPVPHREAAAGRTPSPKRQRMQL